MTSITKTYELQVKGRAKEFAISDYGNYAYTIEKDIFVGRTQSKCSDDLIKLEGHHSTVTALCFESSTDHEFLVSAGSFYIILWDINMLWASHERNEKIRGKIVSTVDNIETIDLKSSAGCERISVTNKQDITVRVHDLKSKIWSKFGDNYVRTGFVDNDTLLIVIAGSRIEAWSIENDAIIWKSNIIQHEVMFLTIQNHNRFVIGCSNNSVMVFGGSRPSDWRKIFSIDLDMEMFRYNSAVSSESAIQGQIVAMRAVGTSKEDSDLESEQSHIICATNQAISIINSQTQEVEVLPFSISNIDFISAIRFSSMQHLGTVTCIAMPLFKEIFEVFKIVLPSVQDSTTSLTMIPCTALVEDSVLKKTLAPSKAPSKTRKSSKKNSVTFHDKIRSSGYNKKPENRKMFSPVTSFSKTPKVQQKQSGFRNMELLNSTDTSCDWSRKIEISASTPSSDTASNVNHTALSQCNRYLSAALMSSTCVIFRQKSLNHIATLTGHDGSVNSSSWNYDSTNILTCSSDGSAKLWSESNFRQPILNMNLKHGTLSKNTEKFSQPISQGQFYYMDKFFILSFGNSFGLYSYHIDSSPKNDVKRYLETNKYKCVKLFHLAQTKSVTRFAAPNNVYSYVTLASGSDKSVRVFDMNVGTCAQRIDNVHIRPATELVLNTGSSQAQPANYNLFYTTAPTDGVKSWDLRCGKCVMKFKTHPDKLPNPFGITPDGFYMATSGDDKKVHFYDIRKAELVQSSVQLKDKISALTVAKDGLQIHTGLRNGDLLTLSSVLS